jgi:hypothetical protein
MESIKHAILIISRSVIAQCRRTVLQEDTGDQAISNYHLKTLFLWECEERHEDWWNKNNIAECIKALLLRLSHCLKRHELPHYFIPQNNLLETCSSECCTRMNTQLLSAVGIIMKPNDFIIVLAYKALGLDYVNEKCLSHVHTGNVTSTINKLFVERKAVEQKAKAEILKTTLFEVMLHIEIDIAFLHSNASLTSNKDRLCNQIIVTAFEQSLLIPPSVPILGGR